MSLLSRLDRRLKTFNPMSEPLLRHTWVVLRALWFIRIRRRLQTQDSPHALRANLMHNLKSVYSANPRMHLLLYPLATIETLGRDARILVIGPRNEYDLFTLVGLGFSLERIRGLDLISYSPTIDVGDMHAMRFEDGSFDAVVCGWTLSYSIEPSRAAAEIARVVRPGGIVAIGVEYSTVDAQTQVQLLGYELQEFDKLARRINSTADIRALFGAQVGHVYFDHDAPRKRSHGGQGTVADVSNVALVFERSAPA